MEEQLSRFFGNLIGRIHGPMSFRFFMQPLMAIIFAAIDGKKDALAGHMPYFWAIFTNSAHRKRKELFKSGWKSVGKIFIVAIILDAIYQFITVRWFYPVEALVTAFVLAIIPYVLLRGPVNRLWPKKGKVAAELGDQKATETLSS